MRGTDRLILPEYCLIARLQLSMVSRKVEIWQATKVSRDTVSESQEADTRKQTYEVEDIGKYFHQTYLPTT